MILSRVKFYPQERVDLEDILALLSAARTDAKLWTKQFLSKENYILKGFTVTGIGLQSATVEMDDSTLILGSGTQDFSYFVAEDSPSDLAIPDSELVDGVRNYVELDLSYEDGTPITKAFWDPSANGGLGAEFNQQVNTMTDIQATISVVQGGFTGDPDKLPLCIIDTDVSGTIKVILDQRKLFFRLGIPSDVSQEFTWASRIEPGYSVNLTGTVGAFLAEETVTFSGGATAKVTVGGTTNITVRIPSSLSFASGNTLTGGTSGAIGTVNTISESFTGADKDIDDFRESLMALMTEIKKLKGTDFWFSENLTSIIGISDFLNSVIIQAVADASFSWNGTELFITNDAVSPASSDIMGYVRQFGKSTDMSLARQDDGQEIQKVEFDLVPSSGVFTLEQDGDVSNNINWNDDATTVQAACNANWTNQVTVTGNSTDGFSFKFDIQGPQLTITEDSNTLANGGNSVTITISTIKNGLTGISAIPIGDGEVLFVKIPTTGSRTFSDIGTGDTNYQVVPIADFVNTDGNYWIAYAENGLIYIRGLGELSAGEETPISDPNKEALLALISAQDARSNQDRNMKLIEGGTWNWNAGSGSPVTTENTSGSSTVISINAYYGESFTPVQNHIASSVGFAAHQNGGALTGQFTIALYNTVAGVPSGAAIATTAAINASSLPATPSGIQMFSLVTPVFLAGGTQYAVVIVKGTASDVPLTISTSNPYAGGTIVSSNDGSSWLTNGSQDALFRVTGTNSGSLAWSDDAFIQIPGLAEDVNRLLAQTVTLDTDGKVAYISLKRVAGSSTRIVSIGDIASLVPSDELKIIARRIGTSVLIGESFLLKDGEYLELDGALAEINRYFGQLKMKSHETALDKIRVNASDVDLLNSDLLTKLIGTFILDFSGAVINFTTGTINEEDDSTPLGINFTPFSIPSGEYFWYGISVSPFTVGADNTQAGQIQVEPATASNASASLALKPNISGDVPLGAIQVRNNAGNIEVTQIRRLGIGSGSGGGRTIKADYLDPVSTVLPSGPSVTLDGQAGVNDDLVLFTNLSSNNNRIYKLSGVGTSIVWTPQRVFNSQFDPLDGDSVRILSGDAFADQLSNFNGSDFLVNDIMRFFDGVSANFWELGSIKTSDILNNTTDNIFSVNVTGSENIIVNYSIIRATAKETGQLFITSDGTNATVTKTSSYLNDAGTEFTASVVLGVLQLDYTADNSGASGTMKFFLQRWSDSPGGPTGVPSYSGAGGGGAAGGANTEIQYNNSGTLDGDSRFKWDSSLGSMDLNGLKYGVLSSGITLNDNQVAPALAIQYPHSYRFVIVEYSIERGTDFRVGRLLIPNNGSTVSLSDDFVETGSTGVTFSVALSGLNINVNYTSTSTGSSGTLKYTIRRWS